ncbi:MAG TPA: hypothetical protein VLT88_00075 [Desulfosarcina sp.]|nr:hypothetical protein [Desulfosarcina sp.]
MKSSLTTLAISAIVLSATLWRKSVWLDGSSAHGRYYVTVLLALSTLTALIALFRLIRRSEPAKEGQDIAAADKERPRQHFRLQFEGASRPRFIQKSERTGPAADIAFPVHDVSETGVGLDCTGIYKIGQTVLGEIIFPSGRTAPVNGIVVREAERRTCLDLHCTIDPALLMAEQRDKIAAEKSSGPRPTVANTALDSGSADLPSSKPKGICRSKAP